MGRGQTLPYSTRVLGFRWRILAVSLLTAICALVAAGTGGAAGGAPAFASPVNYSYDGVGAYSETIADFNADGMLDLATANSDANNVSVLLGDGAGAFGAAAHYSVGQYPRSIAVGDLNDDLALDLLTANTVSGDLSVLLGNAGGTFQAVVSYPVGAFPYSVTTGDMSGDGTLDVAVANANSNDVSVLLGNGDGTLQAAVSYPVGSLPFSVAIGNLDGDGALDLVTADYGSSNVSVLLGNGDGTFQPRTSLALDRAFAVVVTDLNTDAKADLAVASDTAGAAVLLGNGDGTFHPPAYYGPGTQSVAVADLNQDSRPDLIAGNFTVSGISVLRGLGDGTFRPTADYSTGSWPAATVAGDLDRDGWPELVVVDYTLGYVSVLMNTTGLQPVPLYLHGAGATANPPTLFIDATAPTAPAAKYTDSSPIKFSGGNPWKEIGAWSGAVSGTPRAIHALEPLRVWLGLKNSDDQGTAFDLKADLYLNDQLLASGVSRAITGITRNPVRANETTVAFGSIPTTAVGAGDVLTLKLSTRIGTNPDDTKYPGHANARGLRVYYDAALYPSQFAEVGSA